ncbi:MFS transporter [Puniceicoccus vermicola]|uniref:MFS transporter n=1 Tax=Puniceicoccus vermicola TaxID=388746 RepID=A0A7X1E556_9BACT|nr:MFS transporter [Puniceicoccus vermicola]
MKSSFQNLLRAFRYPNYRRFFLGQGIAVAGFWMSVSAMGWLLYRLTDDPFMLGLMGFCMHGPTFFLTPFGGVVGDRISRRNVIIVAQSMNCLIFAGLAVLTLMGVVEVWQILTGCVLLGIVKAFEMPARQALVVDVVDRREDLSNAIALNSTVFHCGRLTGPILAGVLIIPLAGEGACFLIHSIGLIIAVRCFVSLTVKGPKKSSVKKAVFREMGEGFSYAFGFPPVRALLLLLFAFALMGQPYNSLLPVFARTVLEGSSSTFGFLVGASGFGAVVAALGLASRSSILGMGRVIFISGLVYGLALFAFAESRMMIASILLQFVAGYTSINVMVGANTIIQTLVDDQLRGRVMSLLGMVYLGTLPFGTLIFGRLAASIGAPQTVMFGAAGVLAAVAVFGYRLPGLRKVSHSRLVEKGIMPESASS